MFTGYDSRSNFEVESTTEHRVPFLMSANSPQRRSITAPHLKHCSVIGTKSASTRGALGARCYGGRGGVFRARWEAPAPGYLRTLSDLARLSCANEDRGGRCKTARPLTGPLSPDHYCCGPEPRHHGSARRRYDGYVRTQEVPRRQHHCAAAPCHVPGVSGSQASGTSVF